MNRLLLSALALLALANMALAIVCTKNYCDAVDCESSTEDDCNYTIVTNGSMCGCCDACVRMLEEGEECPTFRVMGGPPASTRCADGLVCCSQTEKAGDVTAVCKNENVPCNAGHLGCSQSTAKMAVGIVLFRLVLFAFRKL